nr:MAG TPA: hypothetical protein [Caudoviricetes sp.]
MAINHLLKWDSPIRMMMPLAWFVSGLQCLCM